jgi:hypothetical protein
MKRVINRFSVRGSNVLTFMLLSCTALVVSAGDLTRDPFQPPADFSLPSVVSGTSGVSQQTQEMRVSGILLAGDEALVSIAGRILAPGEEVNGYLLLEVAADHAVFQRGDELLTLNLYPEKDDESTLP